MKTQGIGGAETFTPPSQPLTNTPLPQPVCKSPVAARLHRLVNVARSDVGAKPLRGSAVLYTSAHLWGQRMADTGVFAHTITGIRAVDEMVRLGYPPTALRGQNIAWGYPNPDTVFDDWMDSPPHKDNILSVNYRELGVAVVVSPNGTLYWVLDFGGGTTTRPDLCIPIGGMVRDVDEPDPVRTTVTVGYPHTLRHFIYPGNTTGLADYPPDPYPYPEPSTDKGPTPDLMVWGREGETPLKGASHSDDRPTDDPL